VQLLDIGCGSGKVPMHILPHIAGYTGIDVSSDCIRYCQEVFSQEKKCSFIHLDCRNALYNPQGSMQPENMRFPFLPASFDVIIAISLFTHLESIEACDRYVQEVYRVLRPGGKFFSSWFRSPPNSSSGSADRTVLGEADIRSMFSPFEWLEDWGGDTVSKHDQWQILVQKPVTHQRSVT
jgi:SAM-dependent methyltransferase